MPYTYFALITLNESITLSKFGAVTILIVGRWVDAQLTKQQREQQIIQHLTVLGIKESSDYLLAQFISDESVVGTPTVTITTERLQQLYCFDEQAVSFYNKKIRGGYHYALLNLCIDDAIVAGNRDRITPIARDMLGIPSEQIHTMQAQLFNSRFAQEISTYKREYPWQPNNLALVKDVATFAMITPSATATDDEINNVAFYTLA